MSSSNLFHRLIMEEDLSRRITRDYPRYFGTGDARDVLEALWKQDFSHTRIEYDRYCNILRHEQFAWVAEYDENGIVGDKILRLDLYRKLDRRKDGGCDFSGGLLHVFKHFSCNNRPLSYLKSQNDVPNLSYIIRIIIEVFLCRNLK